MTEGSGWIFNLTADLDASGPDTDILINTIMRRVINVWVNQRRARDSDGT